jgi:hypothetical protein
MVDVARNWELALLTHVHARYFTLTYVRAKTGFDLDAMPGFGIRRRR